ncbi:MAG: Ppx/GppA family phosphatase [Calditrichales bacterium]|nr:MAG: Ppx/GppA family phosphatase [Calditrichales bacterium]
MNRHIAIIDIGTNSTLLLVGQVKDDGEILATDQQFNVTRLGQGAGKGYTIRPEVLDRTIRVLHEYKENLDARNIREVHLLGTEALRIAANTAQVKNRIAAETGWRLQVLEAADEARYSYLGATDTIEDPLAELLVVDAGGGSTELIRGSGEHILSWESIPLGVVKLNEMYGMKENLAGDDIRKIMNMIPPYLAGKAVSEHPSGNISMIGVGGTITTLAAVKEKMRRYDPEKINGAILSRDVIERLFGELNGMSLAERSQIPGIVKGRADVILYGTLIFLSLMNYLEINTVVASDRGLRYGYLKWLSLQKS